MKITKEDLKKLIKEVTAAELAYRDAVRRDREKYPQKGPDLEDVASMASSLNPIARAADQVDALRKSREPDAMAGIKDAIKTIKSGADTFPGQGPLHQAGDTEIPPVKDPRPQRVTSTAPKDPNHVRKFINDLHASGRISRETKIAARRALYGKGGKYDPEMGVEAALAILRDAGVRMELKESYGMVPGTGEEGVSRISVPTQSMVRPEPEPEPEHGAAARKRKAKRWAMAQGLEDYEDPNARFKPKSKTRSSEGDIQREDELEDYYAKLYTLYSGQDIGQPGDATRLPDSFALRRGPGEREDFIKKASAISKTAKATLEEIIKEEARAVLLENKKKRLSALISQKATFWVKEAGLDDATVKSDPAGAWLDILTMVAPHWSKMGNMAYGCQRAPEDINCRVIDVAQKKLNGLLDQANEGDYQKWVSGNFREVKNTFSYMPANKAPESLKRTSIWPIIEKDLPSGGDDL